MDVLTWTRIETVQRLWSCLKSGEVQGKFNSEENFPQIEFADSAMLVSNWDTSSLYSWSILCQFEFVMHWRLCWIVYVLTPQTKKNMDVDYFLKSVWTVSVPPPLPSSFSPSYFNSSPVQIIVMARVVSSQLINGFYRLNISMNYWSSFPFYWSFLYLTKLT